MGYKFKVGDKVVSGGLSTCLLKLGEVYTVHSVLFDGRVTLCEIKNGNAGYGYLPDLFVRVEEVFDAKALADEFRTIMARQQEIRQIMAKEGYEPRSNGNPVAVLPKVPREYTFVRTVEEKV